MISLLERASSPLPASSLASAVHPLWGSGARALVTSIVPVNPEGTAAAVTLRPNRHWRGHRAGQHLTVGVEVDGVRHHRCFTITSLPSDRRNLQVTVQAADGGTVSRHLVHGARPGDLIHLGPAAGELFSTEPAAIEPDRWLFLTAGSGITVALAALRASEAGLLAIDDVAVLHTARSESRLICTDELVNLTSRPDRHLDVRFSEHGAAHLTPDTLDARCPDWRSRHTIACGPPGLVEWCEQHWEQAGLADGLRVERFHPRAAPPSIDLRTPGGHGTPTRAVARFTRSSLSTEVQGATLLDAAESVGLCPPTGCRQGICHTCTTKLVAGEVIDRDHGVRSGAGEHIRLCVSLPLGDVEVDL